MPSRLKLMNRKIAPRVLFFLVKHIRVNLFHSLKSTGGGHALGSILTTEESTLGHGVKCLLLTSIRSLVLARRSTLTARRLKRESPGFATRRWPNSF